MTKKQRWLATWSYIGRKISYKLNKSLKDFVSLAKWDNMGITAFFYGKKQGYGKQIKMYLKS